MINTELHPEKRLYELDYLRGLAALAVVLFHFTYGYDNGLGIISADKFYFKYGKLGVNLFFMISGYVIFMTLNKVERPLDFVVSRFSRLYPSYWTSIIVSLIFVSLVANPFGYENVTIKQILANFTMLQHWLKIKDIDGAYWTLSVELAFYVIMFCLYLSNQLKNIEYYCLAWLAMTFVTTTYNVPLEKYLNELFILRYSPLFIAGILFFRLKNSRFSIFRAILVILSLLVEINLLYHSPDYNLVPVVTISVFYLIFLGLIANKIRLKENRVLLYFGTISYPLYLIHENIGLTLIYNLKKMYDSQLFYVGISLTFVIAVASVITFYIEKPLMNKIKLRYKKYNSAWKVQQNSTAYSN